MFVYCANNPVNRTDPTGEFWEELLDAFTQAFKQNSEYVYTALGLTQMDSPAPGPMDAIGATMIVGVVALCAMVAIDSVFFEETSTSILEQAHKKEQVQISTQERNRLIVFPANPNEFNPVGLLKIYRPGTKNGAFICWIDPFTKIEVFRWDENPNYSNGPHYHILGGGHYYAGNTVPEPFATIYFPFT